MATGDQDVPRLVVTEQAGRGRSVLGLSQPELPIGHSATALAALTDQFSRAPRDTLANRRRGPAGGRRAWGCRHIGTETNPRREPAVLGASERDRECRWIRYRGPDRAALVRSFPGSGPPVRAGVGANVTGAFYL